MRSQTFHPETVVSLFFIAVQSIRSNIIEIKSSPFGFQQEASYSVPQLALSLPDLNIYATGLYLTAYFCGGPEEVPALRYVSGSFKETQGGDDDHDIDDV